VQRWTDAVRGLRGATVLRCGTVKTYGDDELDFFVRDISLVRHVQRATVPVMYTTVLLVGNAMNELSTVGVQGWLRMDGRFT